MHTFKKVGVLALTVFALNAIGAANASAAQFTTSATGSFTGKALTAQVFTLNGGQVRCLTAEPKGTLSSTSLPDLHASIEFRNCTAFGLSAVVSPLTVTTTVTGTVHIQNSWTISIPSIPCHMTIGPQSVNVITYVNVINKLKKLWRLKKLKWKGTGSICGGSGENGVFEGDMEIERVGGGFISYDP